MACERVVPSHQQSRGFRTGHDLEPRIEVDHGRSELRCDGGGELEIELDDKRPRSQLGTWGDGGTEIGAALSQGGSGFVLKRSGFY